MRFTVTFAFRNWLLSVLVLGCGLATVTAQELRIETDVFAEGEEQPLSHTVTLFDSNTVYDFVEQPRRIAVFRPPTPTHAGQFILLDEETHKRTEISTERIAGLIDKLTRWSAEQDDALLKFAANPKFEESFDSETGVLSLASEQWTYRVATIPAEDPQTLARYREFTDWYARLNTMVNNTPPPGPRLALNIALEKNGVVPVEILRRVESSPTPLRAVHLVTWRLSRQDRARLDEARRMLSTFEKVTNEEYITLQDKAHEVRGQSFE